VEASALAVEAGSPRLAGTILVGAAAARLPLATEDWEAAVRRRFPAAEVAEQNLKAFQQGWDYARSLVPHGGST
jgi:Pyruvate/2-oxoacid:ferredoxin oxidoreductase gamma subunit